MYQSCLLLGYPCDHSYFYSPEKDTADTDGHSNLHLLSFQTVVGLYVDTKR